MLAACDASQRPSRLHAPAPTPIPPAGIGERGSLVWGSSDTAWQQTLDVDLRAVMEGVRLAARAMLTGSPTGGRGDVRSSGGEARLTSGSPCIMITASAGGTFPMPHSPVYASAKAGCIQLTRSMAEPLAKQGVRICALCPQASLGWAGRLVVSGGCLGGRECASLPAHAPS